MYVVQPSNASDGTAIIKIMSARTLSLRPQGVPSPRNAPVENGGRQVVINSMRTAKSMVNRSATNSALPLPLRQGMSNRPPPITPRVGRDGPFD